MRKTTWIAALALAGALSFPLAADAHGPYDCWGYSGNRQERPHGFSCFIPGPHGERPGRDNVSSSVILVSVDGDRKKAGMEDLCRKYHLSLVYDYKNFNMYALKTENPLPDRDMEALIRSLSKEKGILSVERDRVVTVDQIK
jgi:hypothetical protein